MEPSRVTKRSIYINGHKTSVSMEDEFWLALKEIANAQRKTLSGIIDMIDMERNHINLSSTIRIFVIKYYKQQCDEARLSKERK